MHRHMFMANKTLPRITFPVFDTAVRETQLLCNLSILKHRYLACRSNPLAPFGGMSVLYSHYFSSCINPEEDANEAALVNHQNLSVALRICPSMFTL